MTACGVQEDAVPGQISTIERYLRSQGVYPYEEWLEDGTGAIQHYYTVQEGVYKYVVNGEREGRPGESQQCERGDSVVFRFAAYVFTGSQNALFYTNIAGLAEGTGLNTDYWSFEPRRIKIGTTPVIKGLENALPYCCKGDSVALFITSDLGFDDNNIGTVPINSALLFALNIDDVIKQ